MPLIDPRGDACNTKDDSNGRTKLSAIMKNLSLSFKQKLLQPRLDCAGWQAHRVDDGVDSRLDITLCKLTKPSGKFSNQIRAVHSAVYGVGERLNSSIVACMGTKNHHCHAVGARWESDPR